MKYSVALEMQIYLGVVNNKDVDLKFRILAQGVKHEGEKPASIFFLEFKAIFFRVQSSLAKIQEILCEQNFAPYFDRQRI